MASHFEVSKWDNNKNLVGFLQLADPMKRPFVCKFIFFAVELVELRVRYKLEFEFEFDITNHLSNVIKQCRVFEIEKKLGKAIL